MIIILFFPLLGGVRGVGFKYSKSFFNPFNTSFKLSFHIRITESIKRTPKYSDDSGEWYLFLVAFLIKERNISTFQASWSSLQ